MRQQTLESLEAYRTRGRHPGRFLAHCLANNLMGAFHTADDESVGEIKEIVAYIYNRLPLNAWGSEERVANYRRECNERQGQ